MGNDLALGDRLWGGLRNVPRAMTLEDIARVKGAYADAARRALAAGFEWLELHFAHGYLAQSFFSVHANHRTDAYGGDAAGRGRFLLETLADVRAVWPERLPLTARFGVIEFDGRDEETLGESIALVKQMRDGGLDLLNASIGFSTIEAKVPWAPAFLAPVAGRVRAETGLPVASAWCIDAPTDAERVVAEGQMDVVMIARAMLADPHYPYQMALALGVDKPFNVLPVPYAWWLSRYRGPGGGAAQ
jgi:2,4-dienoyl-CoA reductase-like NADH-dependent reductase (Old Yellow Enzyme family)